MRGAPDGYALAGLVFAVAWQGWDDEVLPGPPADLTIEWEGDFVLEGSVNIGPPDGAAGC